MSETKKNRIYIDDSGEKEYGRKTSRYFVYAGCVVSKDDEDDLVTAFNDLKEETFGTTDVEVKSNWVRRPRERRERYLEPHGVTENAFDAFMDRWYEQMQRPELTYVGVAIDKVQMLEKYKQAAHYPSATAYHFLLQRYQKHCHKDGRVGEVTIDDMDGSTPKKNQWRELLRQQHKKLKRWGCNFTDMTFEDIAPWPRFGESERFVLLQVADLVAYNVFRQFRDHGDAWDDSEAKSLPVYNALRPLLPRFMRSPENHLEGWGIVKYPTKHTGRWGLISSEE